MTGNQQQFSFSHDVVNRQSTLTHQKVYLYFDRQNLGANATGE